MHKAAKREFIRTLTNTVRDKVIRAVEHMPEDWDGHELRRYLADKFVGEVSDRFCDPHDSRVKAYRNEKLVNREL